MTLRTWKIELRADNEDPKVDEILNDAVKQKARELKTIANLVAGKRKPQCTAECGDMFSSNEEIDILDGVDL